ncbi:hypothetical protein KW784_01615 [Candidatus Parcubacteria bacterium]|nr:hypothetical protein [Candidatus Parcubacteria bacterium]
MKFITLAPLTLMLALPLAGSAHAVIDLTPALAADDAGAESVAVTYRETGRLLALVPVTFTVRATAHADGTMELEYPWYSFLTVDKRDKVEAELKVAVDAALRSLAVGSVKAGGEAKRTAFSPEEARAAATAMKRVMEDNFLPAQA